MANVLLVTADGTAANGDAVLVDLLDGTDAASSRSDTVTLRADDTATTQVDDEANFDMIILSESCSSGTLGTKYVGYAVPMLILEGGVWDDHLTSTAGALRFTADTTVIVEVDNEGHPMTTGPGGTFTDAGSPYTWCTAGDVQSTQGGNLCPGALDIWERGGDPVYSAGWAVPSGAALTAGNAAADIAILGFYDASIVNATADGKGILLNAFEWLAPSAAGPVTGVAAGSYTYTGAATGLVTVDGAAVGSYTFTATAAGVVTAPTVTGVAAGSYTFTGAALGVTTGQFARPTADLHATADRVNELGQDDAAADLFASIDETVASAADFIRTGDTPAASILVVQLDPAALTDPGVGTGHEFHYHCDMVIVSGAPTLEHVVEVREGYVSEGTPGTVRGTDTHNHTTTDTLDRTLTLLEVDASNITDYTDLQYRDVWNTL